MVNGATRPRRLNRLPHLKVKPTQYFWTAKTASDPDLPSGVPRRKALQRLMRAAALRSELFPCRGRGLQLLFPQLFGPPKPAHSGSSTVFESLIPFFGVLPSSGVKTENKILADVRK